MDATSDNPGVIDYKLVDFGCRGVSSMETASIGGAAHLVNFKATDTVPALLFARQYYHAQDMPGNSIPAAEHSTVTSWGREHEVDAMRNMLEQFPNCSVAVVSDSYNIWDACKVIWGEKLKEHVVKRSETGSTVLVRPDSGEPAEVVLQVVEILGQAFGYTLNSKGFKVLPNCIRVIQGDGISLESTPKILSRLANNGWSAENVTFGSGGALLQKVNRDTQKCAYKCSYVEVNGEGREVYKDPITDQGKTSKKGRLTLEFDGTQWTTIDRGLGDVSKDQLVTVFENGKVVKEYTFEQVRENAKVTQGIPVCLHRRDYV